MFWQKIIIGKAAPISLRAHALTLLKEITLISRI
jgi:predicted nucleic acid-binding OB-fold protein